MSQYDNGPITDAFAITPSASPLAKPIRGFHVGGAGDVRVTMIDGTTVTFGGCLAGLFYPYTCTHVLATGTTATSIVGLR